VIQLETVHLDKPRPRNHSLFRARFLIKRLRFRDDRVAQPPRLCFELKGSCGTARAPAARSFRVAGWSRPRAVWVEERPFMAAKAILHTTVILTEPERGNE
jgi:hypothetical protein